MTRTQWERVLRKAQAYHRARAEFRQAILDAHAAGETLPSIADAAGLTKQRIHQIIKEERDA